MAIHTFDAARAMTGLEAERVFCREWDPPNSWFRQGSSSAAIFDMTGGAVFVYRGSWCADGERTSWEASWRIVGERGSLVWGGFDVLHAEAVDGDERDGLFSRTRKVEVPPLDPADRVGGHLGVMQDFVAAVRGGPPPETAGADNLKSLSHGLRGHRERRRRAALSTSKSRGESELDRSPARDPHRHDGQGDAARSGDLRARNRALRLREHPAFLLADARRQRSIPRSPAS